LSLRQTTCRPLFELRSERQLGQRPSRYPYAEGNTEGREPRPALCDGMNGDKRRHGRARGERQPLCGRDHIPPLPGEERAERQRQQQQQHQRTERQVEVGGPTEILVPVRASRPSG
jgi:hypothetical protein